MRPWTIHGTKHPIAHIQIGCSNSNGLICAEFLRNCGVARSGPVHHLVRRPSGYRGEQETQADKTTQARCQRALDLMPNGIILRATRSH